MNTIKSRLGKLEDKSGAGFRMVCPVPLDVRGNEFEHPPANDDIAEISFCCNGQKWSVKRLEDEVTDDFCARAYGEAKTNLDATVILPLYMRWI